MQKGDDMLNSGDDELLALGALLAEVENENCKTEANSLDIVNVGTYLDHKFNKYGDQMLKPAYPCSKLYNAVPNMGQVSKKDHGEENNAFQSGDVRQKGHVCTDPIFGLRFVNPQISSMSLIERMANRKAVSFNELPTYMFKDLASDWVIAGVILSKETKFTSKTGNPFSIWKLTDLRFKLETITIMLFQTAHHELWKTPMGMCVAILNPSFIEKKSYSKDVANLSIDTANKVMILGKSQDLGVCKAKKKNGDPCKNFVNLNECDFCVFHVEKAYKNMDPFKPSAKSSSKLAFNSKSLFANSGQLLQRDKVIIDSLRKVNKTLTDNMSVKLDKSAIIYTSDRAYKTKIASNVEPEPKQRKADLERLKTLHSNMSTFNKLPSVFKSKEQMKVRNPNVFAMQKAINMIKKCPVEKRNPNSVRGTKEGKRRAIEELNGSSDVKRRKIEESAFLGITNILETASVHKDLIDLRQKEEEYKYFDKLSKKEMMEEKMLNTYKLPCKAIMCTVCKYTAFSAADRCKEERHLLKITEGVKRFFQCRDCGNRTTTLFKLPKLSCANCTGSRWEKCAMIRDRSVFDSTKNISLRGDEEKFLGSTSSKVNINLLIPIE